MSKRVSVDEMAPVIREALAESGEVSFISSETSMLPTLRDRKDLVTIKKPRNVLKNKMFRFIREITDSMPFTEFCVITGKPTLCAEIING